MADSVSASELAPQPTIAQRRRLTPAEVLRVAQRLHAQQQLAEAEKAYRYVVQHAPTDAGGLSGLGVISLQLGRAQEAEDLLRRGLAIDPDAVEIRNNLGMALAALNRLDEAIAEFERALEIEPAHGGALSGLGRALGARERFEEAAARLAQAIEIGPPRAELHNDLGAYFSALGRHEEAADAFRQATALAPDFAIAHNNLGNALVALGKHQQAVASYRAAFAISPTFAEAYVNMGSALADLRHPGDALPYFERALALNPHLADAHNHRGQAFVALGHLADARESFVRAIALRPDRAEFYSGLAGCTRLARDDRHFLAMEALAEKFLTLDEAQQTHLHFALAKAYEDQGRFAQAFAHFSAGNALRRRRTPYDEVATLARMRRFAPAFGPETMRRAPPRGAAPDVPIFIVGMPRSGSTLVEQMLASHPQVFGGGELTYLGEEAARLGEDDGADLSDIVRALSDEAFAAIGARYRARLRALSPNAPRITDKLPSNCQHLGLIRMALPNACIIHTRRDPVDTCLSCYAQTFSAGLGFSDDLGDLGRYYRSYADLMAHWRRVLPEGAMLEVQYEDVVADFEPQARRIIDYCGLEWDARCLAFNETRREVITASAAQVREPIYQRSSGRSLGYGRLLVPLIDALGDDFVSAQARQAAQRDPSTS